jgi:hypothetical protein
VFAVVAVGIQHAVRMHRVVYGLARSKTFFHIISETARFFLKKVIEHKIWVSNLTFIFV